MTGVGYYLVHLIVDGWNERKVGKLLDANERIAKRKEELAAQEATAEKSLEDYRELKKKYDDLSTDGKSGDDSSS